MKNLRVGITGQSGFIGTHLFNYLGLKKEEVDRVPFEDEFFSSEQKLRSFAAECDTIVHMAAVNRAEPEELHRTNIRLVQELIAAVRAAGGRRRIIFSSSTQESQDNPYGRSKREGRSLLEQWATTSGGEVSIMVIPNVFGAFGRPFYNSVVATFCHQLTHGQMPEIHIDAPLRLVYVNDLAEHFYREIIRPPEEPVSVREVPEGATRMVSELLQQLREYRQLYLADGTVPRLETPFDRALFNTFRSSIDPGHFPVRLLPRTDERGSLFESMKSLTGGQTFYSITRPAAVRGNHFHLRKFERFCVTAGEAVIRLRRIGTKEIIEYRVTGSEPSFVDIPICHTHNIENVGKDDLVTLFWSNELYNPQDTDTYFERV